MGAFLIQFLGAGLLVLGIALWSIPLALVAAGILVFAFGWILDVEVVDDVEVIIDEGIE